MNGSVWHKAAGLSGAAAVALGAYGAHQFKPGDPYFVEVHLGCYIFFELTDTWTFWPMKRDLVDAR